MKWPYLLLTLVLISCQRTAREKQIEENSRDFSEYIDGLKTISLPFSMRCGLWSKDPISTPPHSNKFGPSGWGVSGLVLDEPNLKVVLYGFPGDDVYPYLFSFDSTGYLIDSTRIYMSNCLAEPRWKSTTYTTIHEDLRIIMRDTGCYYTCDNDEVCDIRIFDKAVAHRKEIQMSDGGRFNVRVTTSEQLSLKELGKNPLWKP